MIKGMEDAFVTGKKEITVKYNGKDIKFFAYELGYLDTLNIGTQAKIAGKNSLAMLVAESITDADGNRFTYEEILKLKKEVAAVLFDAVTSIHNYVESEKKS